MATGTLGTLSPEAGSWLAYGGTDVLSAMTATIQALKTFVLLVFWQCLKNSGLTLD